ncbi:nuclear transport factor 2 family protein [Amycolatopsis pithecellobii]|nr:nuclear transport factor 2 family protein [Amycolatopsis pithecellobii]
MSNADEAAVARFYEHYARVVDDQDYDALAALCSPDVRLILNGDEHHGAGDFVAVYREALGSAVGSRHLITNIGLDLSDGIRARTYLLVEWWSESWTRQGVGRYEDDLAWVDGQLVFAVKRIYLERVVELTAPAHEEVA